MVGDRSLSRSLCRPSEGASALMVQPSQPLGLIYRSGQAPAPHGIYPDLRNRLSYESNSLCDNVTTDDVAIGEASHRLIVILL
jgi:hypothetical protein